MICVAVNRSLLSLRLTAACAAAFLCLALTSAPAWARQKPTTIGEHVEVDLHTSHPYVGSGAPVPQLTWSQEIHHSGATYIAVHFARFQLAPGDYAVVRSPDSTQLWRYEGLGKGDRGLDPGGFFAVHIKGDRAVVELFTAGLNLGASPAYGLHVDRYGRGFNPAEIVQFWLDGVGEEMNLPEPPGWQESICTTDDTEEAKCYQASEPVAYDTARAVARLLLNGSAHCTGWLVGSAGHLMTNEHCITSQGQTDDIDFEFMAEGADCATNCASALACPGTIEASGGTFVTDDADLDYALVIPDTTVGGGTDLPATYGYMRLRESGAVLDERIYIVQHPAGWGKRFAMVSSYPDDVTLGGFTYATSLTETACSGGANDVGYWADTQGGSSGSPVLGYSDHRVVALHHCRGSAFCTTGNPGSDDRNRGVPIEDVIASLGPDLPPNAVCEAPSEPTDLLAVSGGDNQIDLTWTASTPPTEGGGLTYNIYRAIGTCPQATYKLLADGVVGTSYSDTTASADVDYSYVVRGYIAATECESLASDCADATTTGACTEAPAFDGLQSVSNDGASSCSLTLSWDAASPFCSGGPPEVVYNVYRAEPVEGTLTEVATCVEDTTWTDATVDFGLEYDYVVRAEDATSGGGGACADGNEDTNDVTLTGVATGPDAEVFADDVESGSGNFVFATGVNDPGGTTPWSVVDTTSHSPTHSFFVAEQPSVKDQVVATVASHLVSAGAVLEFWHDFDTEATFDGGVLEYSTDGSTWNDIGIDRFLEGGYNSVLSTGFGNPLPDRDAWSGDGGGWQRVQVDLADFVGQSLFFRWRFGCDQSVTDVGWAVDDIRIFAGTECAGGGLFFDGFESGDTSAWWLTVP